MSVILSIQHIVRDFPGVRAVDDVSFAVHAGQCFGLLGPNGAGKSTTLGILNGLDRPSAGRVLFRGRPLDQAYRQVIGVQFQSTALQDFQTVGECLTMFASLYRHRTERADLIRMCNLEEILDRDTRVLSGGQRQRVLLAIALVNDPELLFLDEPTTGLDPQARRKVWDLVETIRGQGKTVVLTTHYMEEAQRLCDEVAIIDHGRIIAQAAPAALVQQHFPAAIVRLPASAWPAGATLPAGCLVRGATLEFTATEVPVLLQDLAAQDVDLKAIRVDTPNLEDVFLKLTGHSLRD
ncbi:MAG: ABC transporter ATP-binding protein [Chromatiaceae bacterium]|nr:MAG: ABC transporter ATP-binding protein [Chromatiaceae bacterium]